MLTAQWCIALLACLGPSGVTAPAQVGVVAPTSVFEVTRTGTSLAMTFGDDGVPLSDLLDLVRKEVGVAFSSDARETAEVRVRINGVQTVESKDLLPWLRSVLASMDFTLLPFGVDAQKPGKPAFYAVRFANGNVRPGFLKAFAPFIPANELTASTEGEETLFTTVFQLQHANAQEAMNVLQAYFSDPLIESVRATMQSNCVLVTGRLRGLRVTQKMLAAMDQAPTDPVVSEVVQLRFVDAGSIGETLAQWSRGRSRSDAVAPNLPGAPNPTQVDVVPYAERNAIIVTGPKSRVEQTKALVAQLDVEAKKS